MISTNDLRRPSVDRIPQWCIHANQVAAYEQHDGDQRPIHQAAEVVQKRGL